MIRHFDVIANPFAATSKSTPFLLNITGDHLIGYATVLFAPLIIPSAAGPPSRFRPHFDICNQRVVLNVLEIAPLPRKRIGHVLANLEGEKFAILLAIDILLGSP
ncbi:MAG: CcdB family protein [Caulobacterales bacterium]